jgi:hypothetical protein
MTENNIISFAEHLKKKNSKFSIDSNFLEMLSEDIKSKPELIEWYNFQNSFNKHKLFLHGLFTANHRIENINPNAGYFVSFTEEHVNQNVNRITNALEWLDRKFVLIDAENCTFKDMAKQIYGIKPKNTHDAWIAFQEFLLKSQDVLIISNISQSKIPSRKSGFARSIIKINDDAHFRGIKPNSDIVFVDTACFLQRYWKDFEIYTNIFS